MNVVLCFLCVLSREIENEDERDHRLFVFSETPPHFALISLIITRVRERKTARKKTKKPRSVVGLKFPMDFCPNVFQKGGSPFVGQDFLEAH